VLNTVDDLYPTVGEHVRLKKTASGCWLVNALANGDQIHPLEAFVLALCTGEHSVRDIAYLVERTLDKGADWSEELVVTTLERRSAYLRMFRHGDRRNDRYAAGDFLYPLESTVRSREGRLDSPGELILVLTHHCNFRCIYCFNSAAPGKDHDLTAEEWVRVLAEAKQQGVVRCTISGGEPMTHPGFREIMKAVLDYGMIPYVCTNGSLIGADDIRFFREIGLPFIQLSLDTVDETVHDRLSGAPGSLPRVRTAIHELVAAGIEVFVKSVITPMNADGVPDLIDRCHEWGVRRLTLDRFDLSNAGRGNQKLFLSREQERALGASARGRQERYLEDGMAITAVDTPRGWADRSDIVVCGALSTGLTILPDGKVSVCEKLIDYPDLTVGDVRTQSVEEIWNSARVGDVMRPRAVGQTCSECPELSLCHTGCFAQTLIVTDDPYQPDPRCWKAEYPNNPYAGHTPGTGTAARAWDGEGPPDNDTPPQNDTLPQNDTVSAGSHE
jgi:radical SAM protein with 4Fe4S-binding SPASM domain